jgi:purine-binding chemotaxis protein CheW
LKVPSLVKYRAGRRAARRAGEAGKRTEYLAFGLASETYAVQIAQLAEILRPPPITEVPRAPRVVLGVVSVRGKLVTVIDLRRRLNLVEAPIDRRSRILLVDSGLGEQLGLLVDEVQQVWRLAAEEIEPAGVLGGDQPVHILGIGRPTGVVGGEATMLILLDLRSIVEAT